MSTTIYPKYLFRPQYNLATSTAAISTESPIEQLIVEHDTSSFMFTHVFTPVHTPHKPGYRLTLDVATLHDNRR